MPKEILINVSEGEECRIALVEDGRLEDLYMERTSAASHVGNIYKGKVTNVEASIQAAFVDFGLGRNGFLHVSDLQPEYFGKKGEDVDEFVGKKMARRDRPPIQRCLRRGDEITVQVIKEGIGTKGPTLSSYLSVSGKMLVMMPGVAGRGVSRKIEDEDERRRLKQILVSLNPPEDCGFILRTECVGKSREEIARDLNYLSRLWDQMKRKRAALHGPGELYAEGDLIARTIRDHFTSDVDRLIVDSPEVADRVRDVVRAAGSRDDEDDDRVELYTGTVPLFHKYGIERDIELMYSRHVPLPSGGSLVIDSTEAIVAIDVNSGKFRDLSDAEMTAFKTDMEAADEICRQLKLRDLGGVIICDFIDLRYERHRRELEERIVENFKRDRAKTKVLEMSQFGIIEITRQRMRPSLQSSVYFDCPHCKGAGLVKTPESMSLDVMRRLAIGLNDLKVVRAELSVCGDVSFYLNNKKRRTLADLEAKSKKQILVRVDQALGLDEMRLELFDNRDGLVVLPELSVALAGHPHTSQLRTRDARPALPAPTAPQVNGGGTGATGGVALAGTAAAAA
ncbi:MAG: rne, partial [Phycisphaerales bacterium]|nr:rne [Phycisphaerales bacterium]